MSFFFPIQLGRFRALLFRRFPVRTLYKAVFFLAAIVSLISRYFGETEIKATLDGMPLQGAIVKVDGEVVGTTPYFGKFLFGSYNIEIIPPTTVRTDKMKYGANMFTVVVGRTIAGDFMTITEESTAPPQPVQVDEVAIVPVVKVKTVYNIEATIEGKPLIGADIEVDGEIVGKTPLKRLISEGDHVIYIYPTAQSNAVEQYMEFTFNPGNIGGEEKLVANFTVQSVIVNVAAVINGQALKGAEVEIDGVMVGMAPISKKLGPGPHTVNVYPPANVNIREVQNMFRVPPGNGQVENLTSQFTSL